MDQVIFTGGPVMLMDGKGRLSVPTRHLAPLKAQCEGHLTVCKHPDGCLWLFPQPVWRRFEAKVDAWKGELDNWRRIFLGSANPLEVDSGGRLLLPPELREWAGMDREVVFMGVGKNFELWDAAREKAREVSTLAAGRPEAVRNLVIE